MTVGLETVSLGRCYMMNWALRNCTLQVPEGSITGLIGPNGAGKSTLLLLAAGISRPSEGSVTAFGQRANQNSTAFLNRVGYLDQDRPLYKNFRVQEMLKFGQKLNSSWDHASATRWLVDLEIPLDWKVSLLSTGQRAQVALAMCMGKRPDLLLLDEPMASLDPLARRGVKQMLLDSVTERGTTVLLSSHIVDELEEICDHVIILSKSKVQKSGTVESLLANHRVLIGPEDSAHFDSVNVVSLTIAGRQATLLIEGNPGRLSSEWQILSPDLNEIVLGYLANSSTTRSPATRVRDTSPDGKLT